MASNEPHEERAGDDALEWSDADERLWSLAERRLEQSLYPTLSPSEEVVRLLSSGLPTVQEDDAEEQKLFRELQRSTRDLDFERALTARRQKLTLGTYITFLLGLRGTPANDAAKDADVEFQTLKELQADRVPADQVRAGDLTRLLKFLQASWSYTEKALLTLVRAEPYEYTAGRNSLFRGAPGRGWQSSVSDSLAASGQEGKRIPNPAYREEVKAVRQLIRDVKSSWSED